MSNSVIMDVPFTVEELEETISGLMFADQDFVQSDEEHDRHWVVINRLIAAHVEADPNSPWKPKNAE